MILKNKNRHCFRILEIIIFLIYIFSFNNFVAWSVFFLFIVRVWLVVCVLFEKEVSLRGGRKSYIPCCCFNVSLVFFTYYTYIYIIFLLFFSLYKSNIFSKAFNFFFVNFLWLKEHIKREREPFCSWYSWIFFLIFCFFFCNIFEWLFRFFSFWNFWLYFAFFFLF